MKHLARTIKRLSLMFAVLLAAATAFVLVSNRSADLELKAWAANPVAKEIDALLLNSGADRHATVFRSASSTPIATATPPVTVPGTSVGVPTTSPVQGPGSTMNSGRQSLHVLVAIKGNYRLEGELDKAGIVAQRKAIAAAQDRVINAIKANTSTKRDPRASVRVRHRYVTVPGLAME